MINGGDDVRVACPLFQAERSGSTPTSPLQFNIGKIDIKTAVKLNSLWHSRLPIFDTGCCQNGWAYAAEFDGIYYAVGIWSNPVAAACPQKTWLELRRFAIAPDRPKNTASRMLRIMEKLIRKDFPLVVKLISYQDEDAHAGTIYKAAGWLAGMHHKGGSWNRPNAKDSNGKPRIRPDLNAATGPKTRWEKDL